MTSPAQFEVASTLVKPMLSRLDAAGLACMTSTLV